MKEADIIRLKHILEAIQEIEGYINGVDQHQFFCNSMMRFACIKQLEIIGEASNHISDEVKNLFTQIEWAQLKGMRNIFVHEYFGIDDKLVWQILRFDVPNLKSLILKMLDGHNQDYI